MVWVLFWKKCFYSGGGEALDRLPSEVVDAPSLGTFKAKLTGLWVT